MTFADTLLEYRQLDPHPLANGVYVTKRGVRGYPAVHPGAALLAQKADLSADVFADATFSAGFVALAAAQQGIKNITVLESSRAALLCVKETFKESNVTFVAGAPWDLFAESTDLICLLPQADKGTARVSAEFTGAYTALKAGGAALSVMHKDQGAKRYEKRAAALFGEVKVIAKAGGWRLSKAVKQTEQPLELEAVQPLIFDAAGLTLEALPGVYAAGKLDPGTALLLETLDMSILQAQNVLDLGCGYGLLALKASLAGASVTALDDDLLAVRSTHQNAERYGLDVRVLHSDVDSEIKGEIFDAVLMNPPFHVGKQVSLEVPRAFLAAAHEHLRPGGVLTLVANKALPYEQDLAWWGAFETLATDKQFKVLRAVKS